MTLFKSDDCLQFVTEVLTVLRSTNQHEKVFALVVDRVVRLLDCKTCAVIVVNPATEYLQIEVGHGVSHTFSKDFHRRFATGPKESADRTGAPIVIPDSSVAPELAKEVELEHPYGSCVCVPMTIDDRTFGYLHTDASEAGALTSDHVRVLQGFADFAALALHKSRQFEEILRLDTTDHDTGLRKYPAFLERLQEEMAHADSSAERLGLLVLDIDNYKQIALTFGTDMAKRTLHEIADEIRSDLRPMDAAGRYGFDECILLRVHVNSEEMMRYADELRRRIEGRTFAGGTIRTSVSIGVAAYPEHAGTERGLMLAVREALYEAQRSGRNRVRMA
jgi:diguanylate cyclase (GGDEF)-like protein